jgi:hypothetical protein
MCFLAGLLGAGSAQDSAGWGPRIRTFSFGLPGVPRPLTTCLALGHTPWFGWASPLCPGHLSFSTGTCH